MKHLVSKVVSQERIARWFAQAKPVSEKTTWTEKRLAIVLGEHTYIVQNNQVFQCAHCGHYDPDWSASEILAFVAENFGVKPIEIEITCTVAVKPS